MRGLFDQRYEITGELGRGGMGVVYRARDVKGERDVALKVTLGTLKTNTLERFRREGELTARLTHPGIVRVFSAGEIDGRPYIAYEFVDGETLEDALPRLDLRARVALVRDAARALGHAHAHGIVHRDVKAENILVDANGRARVADFGLATASDLDRLTKSGTFLGTPAYMSPEQVDGRRARPGPRSDVWSLGVLLYLTLTDELPFVGGSLVEFVGKIMQGVYDPPQAINPEAPAGLAAICARALAVDAARRYADGEAMALDLDAWLEGRYVAPRPRLPLALAGVAALLLGVGGWALAAERTPPAPQTASPTVRPTEPAPRESKPDPLRLAEAQRRVETFKTLEPRPRLREATRWLRTYRDLPAAVRAPVEALAHEAQLTFPLLTIKAIPPGALGANRTRALYLSSDLLLTQSGDEKVRCWSLAAPAQPVWIVDGGSPIPCGLGIHPRGEAFVVSMSKLGGEVRAYDAKTRAFRLVPGIEPGAELRTIKFSPDGQHLLIGVPYVGALIYSWPELEHQRTIKSALLRDLSVSRDGRLIAAAGGPWTQSGVGYVRVWTLAKGELVFEREQEKVMRLSVEFSPSEDRLAVGTLSGAVYSFRVDDPETITRYLAPGGANDAVSFGRGGAHGGNVSDLRFSHDGTRLYSTSKPAGLGLSSELRVWDTTSGELLRDLTSTERSLMTVDLSPDGRTFALGSEGGPVEVHLTARR